MGSALSIETVFDDKLRELVLATRARALWIKRKNVGTRVQALLSHVFASVPFYSSFSRRGLCAETLWDLPLIQRADVAKSPARFISDRFSDDELLEFRTSGTSGIPLRVTRDYASYYEFAYETFRVIFDRVPELKDSLRSGKEAIVVINDNPERADTVQINPSLDFALVKRVIIGRSLKSDRQILATFASNPPPLLHGRPRSLLRFVELLASTRHAERHRTRPKAIFSSGDDLGEKDRRVLEECFQAPVYNAYASQEAGFVAIECASQQMHVIDDRAIVEVLAEPKGPPSLEGAGELVVTNLENWSMSFLRYKTGDIGAIRRGRCSCGESGTIITKLDGRQSVYFTISGRRINPSVLNGIFEELPVSQFQVIQKVGLALHVKWVAESGLVDALGVERSISTAIVKAVGSATVTVTQVQCMGAPGEKVQRYVREAMH